MNWRWNNKGIPNKEMIAKQIINDIELIEKLNSSYISSGRIFIMKYISEDFEGKHIDYFICLNDRCIRGD